MTNEQDPIQSALESLKNRSWTGEPFDPQLEERLMKEFNTQNQSRRTPMRVAALVALSIVLVGGGAFAATGGIEKIRSWVFSVNINGQQAKLIANDGEPATMTIQGDDGKTTTISVLKATDAAQGDKTHVTVNATGPGSEDEQVVKMVRRQGPAPEEANASYTMDDIGDARATQTWTDKAGLTNSLYVIPSEDGEWIRVFRVTTDGAGSTSVQKLAQVPSMEGFEGITPQVSTDDSGVTTLVFDNGNGEKRVLKTRMATATDGENLENPNNIQIRTEDGRIQVDVEANSADDDQN
jgi:ketosteroid isomerase-like protein